MAVPQDPKGSDPQSYLRKTLYSYRYLVLGVVLAAVAGQIALGYSTASSRIGVSVAALRTGRSTAVIRREPDLAEPGINNYREKHRTVERRCIHVERPS
jgi:hypothetical protein